jgi:hypothetical protein
MQKRAGVLFISLDTQRILLVYENTKWTVPTFEIIDNIFDDGQRLILKYTGDRGKLLPIELYLSEDKGFEYGTYICLVNTEFLTTESNTICWSSLVDLPKGLHSGLKSTILNPLIRAKIDTVLIMSANHDLKNQ